MVLKKENGGFASRKGWGSWRSPADFSVSGCLPGKKCSKTMVFNHQSGKFASRKGWEQPWSWLPPANFSISGVMAVPRRGAFSGVRPAKTLIPKPLKKNTAQKKKREFRGASLNPKRKNGRDGPPANAARGGRKRNRRPQSGAGKQFMINTHAR